MTPPIVINVMKTNPKVKGTMLILDAVTNVVD